MKKWFLILLVLCVACSVSAGERQLKLLFRDYKLTDVDTRPLSAGAILWENKELPDHVGLYGSVAPVSYHNFRIETGGMATWNEKKDRVEIGMLTGISYKMKCNIVIGAWYAPFWNTYGKHSDDPWGVMVGYAFPTPGFGK